MRYSIIAVALLVMVSGCTASKQAVQDAIRQNPQIVIEALAENKVALLELVEEGAKERQVMKMAEAWRLQAADPVSPVLEEGRAALGKPDAPITIVEYSDFLCPYCSQGARTVNSLVKDSNGGVRVIFKHSPRNKKSYELALMYEAIAMQDAEKAWEFGERVFDSQRSVYEGGASAAKTIAKDLGVDVAKMEEGMKSKAVAEQVRKDAEEGARFGVSGTPTFFVNGVKIEGAVPERHFLKAIEIVEEVQGICVDCDLQ